MLRTLFNYCLLLALAGVAGVASAEPATKPAAASAGVEPTRTPSAAKTSAHGRPAATADTPVVVKPLELQTGEGPVRGWVATVDLADPRVSITVSDPRDGFASTADWADHEQLDLAVNANYFSATDAIGLTVIDGVVVSEARGDDPVLLGYGDRARVVADEVADLGEVRWAVAGVGRSERVPSNSALVTDGTNTGATARVAADQRHPRTAAGVTEDGRTLILMTIDGRQDGWSIGVDLPTLGDLMIAHGAHHAVNLDGGGSTAFHHVDADGVTWHNKPSDGEFRRVAVSLGVRVAQREGGEGEDE